jgi:signal transduction histidine kinase
VDSSLKLEVQVKKLDSSGSVPSGSKTEGAGSTRTTGRVLLVDDSALVRDFVGGLIFDWGFLVETVDSADAALDAIASSTFDVIVTDSTMPGMSGIELLTTLRMRGLETPVIMLSSISRTSEILRAIHQGAFDYIVKDEAIEPLRVALLRAIQHIRLVNENARLLRELGRLNSELENRVRERTVALEQVNARLVAERTELETTLTRLNETQEQLVQMEKMASVGLLTAGIAHEINNPLGFILPNFQLIESWLESARHGQTHERVQSLDDLAKVATECRRGLDRIARIVRQLRIFSHPGRQDLGPVDVDAVVRSVIPFVEREIANRATLTMYSGQDCIARGSDDRLRQVLLNLLINSAQSFTPGRKDGKIEVFVELRDGEVIVRVIDNGCGIAPENIRRAFDPFFTTKAVGHGTGLGLAISRDLVQKMGGNIALESQLGRGTSVTVTLRRWRDDPGAAQAVEPPRTPTPELISAEPTRRLSIIIIEDETALLAPLRRMLADRHDVLTFSNPRDGMHSLVERDPPDVIICDINMPEISGLELYREVTRVKPFLADRFVFLTGGDSDELAQMIQDAPRRVLEKPVHRHELIAAIDQIAHKKP